MKKVIIAVILCISWDLIAQVALPTFQAAHVLPSLYSLNLNSHTFTNCGATGRNGPTLTNCKSSYNVSWENNTDFFNVQTQGVQEWTVPSNATYTIEVWGAQGGGPGGLGARMKGDFTLTMGTVLKIVVGQEGIRGGDSNGNAGSGSSGGFGGGGGTFVYSGNTLYIAAGGGGGDGQSGGNGIDGTTATSGTASSNGTAGGSNGSYGSGTHYDGASAGSGWASADPYTQYADSNGLLASKSKPTWLGAFSWRHLWYNHGGFGGGGCSIHAGGAGGGYSGGGVGNGSSYGGGGGGSYNSGSNASNSAGVREDHGQVIITRN